MKPSELSSILPTLIKGREPVLLTGPVGIGKTDTIKNAAKEAGAKLIICHPVCSDPTDFKGLPAIVEGEAVWLPYGDLKRMVENETEPLVVFFDDLGQSTQTVQSAIMQLVLGREINSQKVSDSVVFMAATNRRTDKAGVKGIITPLLSRFSTIIPLEVSVSDWTDWAISNGVPAELIAFIKFRPELLHSFDPNHVDSTGDSLVNQPCPRTITAAGRLLNLGLDGYEVIKGATGEAFATEFLSFLARIEQLGDLPARISKGESPEAPEDSSALYALTSCLSKLSGKEDKYRNIITWVTNYLPEEFAAFYLTTIEAMYGSQVTETGEFTDLCIKSTAYAAA